VDHLASVLWTHPSTLLMSNMMIWGYVFWILEYVVSSFRLLEDSAEPFGLEVAVDGTVVSSIVNNVYYVHGGEYNDHSKDCCGRWFCMKVVVP